MITRLLILGFLTIMGFSVPLKPMQEAYVHRELEIWKVNDKTVYAAINSHSVLLGHLERKTPLKVLHNYFTFTIEPNTRVFWTALTGVRISEKKAFFALGDSVGMIELIVWSGNKDENPHIFPAPTIAHSWWEEGVPVRKVVINLTDNEIRIYQKDRSYSSWITIPEEVRLLL